MNNKMKFFIMLYSVQVATYVLAGTCLDDLLRFRRLPRLAREISPATLMLDTELRALREIRLQTSTEWQQLLRQMHDLNIDRDVLNLYINFFENTDIAILSNGKFRFFQLEVTNLLVDHEGINLNHFLHQLLLEKLLVLKEDFNSIKLGPAIFPILRRPARRSHIVGSEHMAILNNSVEVQTANDARALVRKAGLTGARVQIGQHRASLNYLTREDIMDFNRYFLYRLTGEVILTNDNTESMLLAQRTLFRDLIHIANDLGVEVYIDSSLDIHHIDVSGVYLTDLRQIRLSSRLAMNIEFIYALRHELEHARFQHDLRGLDNLLRANNLGFTDLPTLDHMNDRQRDFIRLAQTHLILFNKSIKNISDEGYIATNVGHLLTLYDEARATESNIQLVRELNLEGWEIYAEAERIYGYSYVEKYFNNHADDMARFIFNFPRRYPMYIAPLLISAGALYVLYRYHDGIWEIIVRRQNENADFYRIPVN